MFYCDPCAEKNGYVKTLALSHGPCELCGAKCLCNDCPSHLMKGDPDYTKKKIPGLGLEED
ncbi:MAG: hypothetical protein ACTSSP_04065 [Candidatus Asgardarchaeia archaeon]